MKVSLRPMFCLRFNTTKFLINIQFVFTRSTFFQQTKSGVGSQNIHQRHVIKRIPNGGCSSNQSSLTSTVSMETWIKDAAPPHHLAQAYSTRYRKVQRNRFLGDFWKYLIRNLFDLKSYSYWLSNAHTENGLRFHELDNTNALHMRSVHKTSHMRIVLQFEECAASILIFIDSFYENLNLSLQRFYNFIVLDLVISCNLSLMRLFPRVKPYLIITFEMST
uniref:Uncharacterized protein n=1 Tax=Strigamia maritima TaxID=126957 RepID=T1IMW9_STRMM